MTASLTAPRSVRLAFRRIGVRASRRSIVASTSVVVAVLALALVALAAGDYPIGLDRVLRSLVADQGDFASRIVREWRLPRMLAAVLFGAALGLSGAVFQSLTRNPLGSPDVIGFSTGSYTGALVVLLLVGGGALPLAGGALVGGLVSGLLVYLLAYRGGLQGFRLIVVGIGITALLGSVNRYLLLQTDTQTALAASVWGLGSISLVGWAEVLPAAVAVAALVPAVAVLAPSLRQLELGDDAAQAHGVHVERDRLLLLTAGVALVAVVTAASGPIAFVALTAPQIARRLHGSAGVPLVGAALVGAALLLSADLVAQHVLPTALPVGVVTVVLGGGYLVAVLLVRAVRR